MTTTRTCLLGAIGAIASVWVLGVTLSGQAAPAAPAQAPAGTQMAETVFKNVQILKGIPVDEFMTTMGFFSASTGLNCTDCHTDESGGNWDRYADDNDLKRRTRMMMLMVQNINRANFGGRQVVTCTTCHRGFSTPQVMPSLNTLYGEPPPDEPGDPFVQAPGQPQPTVLLDKYLAAAGGAQRVAALTGISGKGTYHAFDDADDSPMELFATAQGQRTILAHLPQGLRTETVNAQGGWLAAPATDRPIPLIDITGQELEGVRVELQAFFPANITTALRNLRTSVPMILEDDTEVQCVQGETAGGAVVTLCFNQETGLLRRMVRFTGSPVGRLVTRVDYFEHKDVAGVKVPSKWRVSWLSGKTDFALTDIQANPRIDATRFNKPALAPRG